MWLLLFLSYLALSIGLVVICVFVYNVVDFIVGCLIGYGMDVYDYFLNPTINKTTT